jgi:hypothetical protein
MFLTFFEHNIDIKMFDIIVGHNIWTHFEHQPVNKDKKRNKKLYEDKNIIFLGPKTYLTQ